MHMPTHRSCVPSRITFAICFAILFFISSIHGAIGQESVLVTSRYSKLSVYDLPLQNLTETINGGYITWSVVVDPNNPRLAYIGAAAYISVFDLTLSHFVNRIYGVYGLGFMAFSADGKYLLLADNSSYSLDVIDAARQKVARKIDLRPAMRTGATGGLLGSIVVVGPKAYVTTQQTDQNRPAIAVVDLRTFKAKSIAVPSGYFDGSLIGTPNAAATPDGQHVAIVEDYNSDNSPHLLLISTRNDRVANNFLLANDPAGILITQVNSPGSVYGYILGTGSDGKVSATAFDLNPTNSTYGQVLPATEVPLNSYFAGQFALTAAAINGNGSKLVIGGFKAWTTTPNPNLVEVDTGLMFSNPAGAIVGQATAAGGVRPYGIAIAPVTTTAPSTAPTITNVSSSVINNSGPNTITITGTNFLPGAMVRVGTMPLLAATGVTPTSLQVTVPQNAPAQAGIDVVVTNPNTSGPRSLQYQSGLLKAGLTISANPAFEPQYQFASFQAGAYGVSVFEPTLGTMLDNSAGPPPIGITFNTDGAGIYGASSGPRGSVSAPQAVAWSPVDVSVQARAPLTGAFNIASQLGSGAAVASVNPATGNPVVFVPERTYSSPLFDVAVQMVDTHSSSPTVIQTIHAGVNLSASAQLTIWGGTATPDGKYVYVNFQYHNSLNGQDYYQIAIFDVVHGTATAVSTDALGVAQSQNQIYVTPDGQSLLVNGYSPISSAAPIAVLDIGTQPKNPVLITTITGTPPPHVGGATPFKFASWQVVGKQLFALDTAQGAVVAFNFDRSLSNFSQLASYSLAPYSGTLAVSPDGALVYVTNLLYDQISVLDANLLANGQDPMITNIFAFPAAYQVAVSPALISATSLQVSTLSLTSGTQGVAYSSSLTATGGVPPYTWAVTGGSLPSGLSLGISGQISGTPNGPAGPSPFTATVTDSKGNTVNSAGLSITIQAGAPLQITTASLPSGPVNAAYYATLGATGGVPPYTWTVTAGTLPPGMNPLSSNGVISGTPTLGGSYPFTVQVTDSASPPNQKTAPLSIQINSTGNTALLAGTYAFQLSAFTQTAGQAAYIGSFVADGNGTITGGALDFNGVTVGPFIGTLTGNYSMASTGIGKIILHISNGAQLTLAFVLSSSGNGRIIEYDDTTGHGDRGSGVLRKQDTTAFSLSKISGTYAYGFVGADKLANRAANVGEFHSDGIGNLSSGMGDFNDNGVMSSYTFAGTVSGVDSNTGRATSVFSGTFGNSHLTVYVVNSAELLIIETHAVQGTGTPMQSGTALQQTGAGSFNNGSVNGISIVADQALPSGPTEEAEVGFLTTDGVGNFRVILDQNRGGVMSQQSDAGRYSVSPNGRMTLGGQSPIFYLVSQNRAFYLGQDSKVEFGSMEPQSPGPFTNASFSGTFAGGALAPVDANVRNEVDMVSVDGAGGGFSSGQSSDPGGLFQGVGNPIEYNVAPNGRGLSPDGTIIYAISPNKFALLQHSQTAGVDVYEH